MTIVSYKPIELGYANLLLAYLSTMLNIHCL